MKSLLTLTPCLLGLWLLVAPSPSNACSFPHYLTRRPRWEAHISLNRRHIEVYWRFHERSLEIVDLNSATDNVYGHDCVLELPDQKFVIQSVGADDSDTGTYMCVQFLLRSPQIVQVRKSAPADDLEAEELCADSQLHLDPWPLVWPEVSETYHTCPLTGGYDFSLVDHEEEDEALCQHSHLKPRLESECMTGEAFSLDFRNFECRGRLEMEVLQRLVCLGTWTEDGHSYTILTDDDELWPRLWLLRFSVRRGREFTAHLFNDIVADSSLAHTQRYFQLHFTQAQYPSLCENEAYPCDDCSGEKGYYCQKTCHRCDELQDVNACEFDLQAQGEWVQISHHGPRDITVTSAMIYADDLLPLQCFDLHAEDWFEDKNYRAMATLYKNGCKPRYTCVEFERLSPSVLLYRLSQNLVWPHSLTLTAQDVCAEARFTDDPLPLQDDLRSQHLKALVKKSTRGRPHSTVNCGITGKFQFSAVFELGLRNCTAYLDTCAGSSHDFRLQTESECYGSMLTETHRCLGTQVVDDVRMVITEKAGEVEEGAGTAYCWVFHREEWEPAYTVYLLYASDCHKDIGRQVRYYRYKGHLAQFSVNEGPGYLGSHACAHQFPTQAPPTAGILAETTSSAAIKVSSITPRLASSSSSMVHPQHTSPLDVYQRPTPSTHHPSTETRPSATPTPDKPTPDPSTPTPKSPDSPQGPSKDKPLPGINEVKPRAQASTSTAPLVTYSTAVILLTVTALLSLI